MEKEKILVVDDEEHLRHSLSILLKEQGFEVITAENGTTALQKMVSDTPDVVLLDMVLPDISGMEIITHFQDGNPDFKIIVITGNATIESAVEALKKGVYDYLKKPFEFEELLKRVENALEQKRLRAESMVMKKNLQASEERFQHLVHQSEKMKAVAALAGGMAHDFNNILMNVLGYTSLLLSTAVAGSSEHEKLVHIEKQVRSGTKITKQLLNFAKGTNPDPVALDIRHVIENISGIYQKTQQHISIAHVFADTPLIIDADEGQMEQVFLNLYINACQAMPHGGEITVTTSAITVEADTPAAAAVCPGRYVVIKVKDTGTGMDEETRKRIFEPFFTTKSPETGSGLGLFSCYGIIKNNGGIITVSSKKGVGSEFVIYLPASDNLPQKTAPPQEKPLTGTETVLLIDDEPSMLELEAEMLETLGYHTLRADSPDRAVEIFRHHHPSIDLVLLDHFMPGMTGRDLFNILKPLNTRVRFILTSGCRDASTEEEMMNQGFCAFIQKPFGIHDISRKIREALDRSTGQPEGCCTTPS